MEGEQACPNGCGYGTERSITDFGYEEIWWRIRREVISQPDGDFVQTERWKGSVDDDRFEVEQAVGACDREGERFNTLPHPCGPLLGDRLLVARI